MYESLGVMPSEEEPSSSDDGPRQRKRARRHDRDDDAVADDDGETEKRKKKKQKKQPVADEEEDVAMYDGGIVDTEETVDAEMTPDEARDVVCRKEYIKRMKTLFDAECSRLLGISAAKYKKAKQVLQDQCDAMDADEKQQPQQHSEDEQEFPIFNACIQGMMGNLSSGAIGTVCASVVDKRKKLNEKTIDDLSKEYVHPGPPRDKASHVLRAFLDFATHKMKPVRNVKIKGKFDKSEDLETEFKLLLEALLDSEKN